MFDRYINRIVKTPLQIIAKISVNHGISANAVTFSNVLVNIMVFLSIWFQCYVFAIVCILPYNVSFDYRFEKL